MEDFGAMPGNSRLWVYQADRALTTDEKATLLADATAFVGSWQSHGAQVRAAVYMPNDYVLIFAVDQDFEAVSGCSIDTSVRFMREQGQALKVDFFNRLMLLVKAEDTLDLIHVSDFTEGISEDKYSASTQIHDNTVATLDDWKSSWVKTADQLPWLATWLPETA